MLNVKVCGNISNTGDFYFFLPTINNNLLFMITQQAFEKMALSLPETEKIKHFERIGFKVKGKRMFATYLAKDHTANIFLTPVEQSVYSQVHEHIYPIANKWGAKGATTFDLNHVPAKYVKEALHCAYNEVVKPKGKSTS